MKKASVILADWNVRESFHSVDCLNKQTYPRDEYEIIWIEYYANRPKCLREYANTGHIDRWIVLNKTGMYRKHLVYNEGIVASTGEVVVICDSDALFSPTFIESIINTFEKNKDENIVLYLDEVRNNNRCFYPFKKVSWETVMETPGLINWDSALEKPSGLTTTHDIIHCRNYGSCFCAKRKSIIEAGGFDEHTSYDCFTCGPYELGWRLINNGHREIWHQSEWLLHLWHPWIRPGIDIMGETDGRGLNSTALEARKTSRIAPLVENKKIKNVRTGGKKGISIKNKQSEVFNKIVENKGARTKNRLYKLKFIINNFFAPIWIDRILIVAEWDPENLISRNIEFSGLVGNIRTFSYDLLCHKYRRQKMSELLVNECKEYNPELIIFVSQKDTNADIVEPEEGVVNKIVDELGIKVYVCDFNFSEKRNIYEYPAVNAFCFYNRNIERDIDVTFWGSVPVGSRREEYIELLRKNGINVCTRIHRVSPERYAEILSRSKISLNISNSDNGNGLSKRAFEVMACKSLLLEESISGTGRLFSVNKDFAVFSNKEELLEKVKYYLRNEEERKEIAQEGHKKVVNIYNARNMWESVFKNIGFSSSNIEMKYLRIIYMPLRLIARAILSQKNLIFIRSVADRLHIDLKSGLFVRFKKYVT